jgi:hypothetical protein
MSQNIFDGADIAERHGKMLGMVLSAGGSVSYEIEHPNDNLSEVAAIMDDIGKIFGDDAEFDVSSSGGKATIVIKLSVPKR